MDLQHRSIRGRTFTMHQYRCFVCYRFILVFENNLFVDARRQWKDVNLKLETEVDEFTKWPSAAFGECSSLLNCLLLSLCKVMWEHEATVFSLVNKESAFQTWVTSYYPTVSATCHRARCNSLGLCVQVKGSSFFCTLLFHTGLPCGSAVCPRSIFHCKRTQREYSTIHSRCFLNLSFYFSHFTNKRSPFMKPRAKFLLLLTGDTLSK